MGMWVWVIHRFGHNHRGRLARVLYKVLDLLVVRTLAGARIPAEVTIGERVGFVHDAQGVVIHAQVTIGDDCTIYHQVTIGHVYGTTGAPKIGNGVLIGPGAKILGPITVGDCAAIGANAVVTKDVPAGSTVVAAETRLLPPKPGWVDRGPRY